jgi:hypothetical protein
MAAPERSPAPDGGLFLFTCDSCGGECEPATVDEAGNFYCEPCAGKKDAYADGVGDALEAMLRAAIAGARDAGWSADRVRVVVDAELGRDPREEA